MSYVTPVLDNWLESEMTKWVDHEKSVWQPIVPVGSALVPFFNLKLIIYQAIKQMVLKHINDGIESYHGQCHDI